MESFFTKHYRTAEEKIIRSLTASDLRHRTKSSTGIWLGPLISLSALFTFLNEDASYSELCLLIGTAGGGLLISCICLYARLTIDSKAVKDFHFLYWIPTILLTLLFLLIGHKAIFVSVPWGIAFGTLSTWGVIQVMLKCPGCFTLGEATIVTHSIILFLISACTNLPLRYHLPPIHDNDITTVILQVSFLYVILISVLCANFQKLQEPVQFYSLMGVLAIVAYFSLYILLDQWPIAWLFSFVFESKERIYMILYWMACLILAALTVLIFVKNNAQADTSSRKIFHILAVMVYIPGLLWQQTFLYLASGIILAIFVLIEILRILNMPPLGKFLQNGFDNFADEKDSLISLTPLYLLCGLSATLWLPTESMRLFPLMSGVLTIGIGDTTASIVGSKWGKHKWNGSHKSIEGTLACIIAQLIVIIGFTIVGLIETSLLVRGILSVILISLVEAQTEQVDNLALPFLMYLCLVF